MLISLLSDLDQRNLEANIQKFLENAQERASKMELDICRQIRDRFTSRCPYWLKEIDGSVSKVEVAVSKTDEDISSLQAMLEILSDENCAQVLDIKRQINEIEAELKEYDTLALVASLFERLSDPVKIDYVQQAKLFIALEGAYQTICSCFKPFESNMAVDEESAPKPKVDRKTLDALKDEITWKKEPLILNLYRLWGDAFRWERESSVYSVILRIKFTNRRAFQSCLEALTLLDLLKPKLEELAIPFRSEILDVIKRRQCADIILDCQADDQMIVSVRTIPNDQIDSVSFDSFSLLDKISALFDRLSMLLNFTVRKGDDGGETGHVAESLFSMFGRLIGEELLYTIRDACLLPSVPRNELETTSFDELVKKCIELQTKLLAWKCIPENVEIVDCLLANKEKLILNRKCEGLLTDARALIISDLKNEVEVEVGTDRFSFDLAQINFQKFFDMVDPRDDNDSAETVSTNGDESDNSGIISLPLEPNIRRGFATMFHFPKCRVSESATKFMNLLKSALDEAVKCNDISKAKEIVQTTRDMLYLYLFLAPFYHRQHMNGQAKLTGIHYRFAMLIYIFSKNHLLINSFDIRIFCCTLPMFLC
ncbi:unnamed protein product [Soboliphyme baturini]|uniref:Zw10-domain-containing protein n=1 Tax=Soboliphyme baturini TaxID=241478 RepID=A0A183J313_9BILA|nr:unnamed protein product [Soboliphyme baturini]